MTDPDDKNETVGRHYRSVRKQQTRDDREQLKKKRNRQSGPKENKGQIRGPQIHDWDEDRRHRPRKGNRNRTASPDAETRIGLVIGVRTDRLDVRLDGSVRKVWLRRGRPLPFPPAVGDRVRCETDGDIEIAIDLLDRDTRLSRPDPHNRHRERVIAANVDMAVVVLTAAEPDFKPALIDRYLVALDVGGVAPVICVNKFDLVDQSSGQEIQEALAVYRELGISCVATSAVTGMGIDELRSELSGRTVVFSGHSGVGKSALLNLLDPSTVRATGVGRSFDGKGRHTTTRSELRELDCGTRVIDTPGIREFGLWAVDPGQLRVSFPGISELAERCRFGNCQHCEEPDCAVRDELPAPRYEAYRKLLAEAAEPG